MTLGEYHDLLSKHDWTYDYSDDPRVWRRGKDAENNLLYLAHHQGPAYTLMYKQFYEAYFNGPAYGTEGRSIPPRPTPDQEQALKSIMSQE